MIASILCLSFLADGNETDALSYFISWEGNLGTTKNFIFEELFPQEIKVRGLKQCLANAYLKDWRTLVTSHTAITDDHIRVFTLEGGHVTFSNINDDSLSIKIPNASGDGDDDVMNRVTDIGVLATVSPLSCPHPLDSNAPDIENQPRIFVLTSDGILRVYMFGSLDMAKSCSRTSIQMSETLVPVAQQGAKDEAVAANRQPEYPSFKLSVPSDEPKTGDILVWSSFRNDKRSGPNGASNAQNENRRQRCTKV